MLADRVSWLLAALFTASAGLLALGGLPPWQPWRMSTWAVLLAAVAARLVAARNARPLVVLILWPALVTLAMELRYPCWRVSNAEWCGHACDDDPCTCARRTEGPGVYGAGEGCVGE